MGRACRACSEDIKMANLLGIDTHVVISITFVLGAAAEVLLLKAETKIRRKRCFNQTRSRLDSRTAEILAMKNAGLSAAKIQLALDAKGLTVDESTVWQFLKKQQEKYGLI